MVKKWVFICGLSVVLVACAVTAALSFFFNGHDLSAAKSDPVKPSSAAPVSPTPIPFGVLVEPVALKGQPVAPEKFLAATSENNGITVSYADTVDFSAPGYTKAALRLTQNGVTIDADAGFYVLEPVKVLEKEAGAPVGLIKPEDFIANYSILKKGVSCDMAFVTDVAHLDVHEIRLYAVELTCNGIPFSSYIGITDTTPPIADTADVTVNTGTMPAPEDFVRNVYDFSPYYVFFPDEPDVFLAGDQPLVVAVADIYGNTAELTAMLTVMPNESPPVITGAHDIDVVLGDSVIYRKHVSAHDSFGNPLAFTVNNDNVDIHNPGVYTAVYRTEDASGHITERPVSVHVVSIDMERLDGLLDTVLAEIIAEGMTPAEKARKIFDWVTNHVAYVSDAPKNSVYEGAYRALQQRSGDCYTFYAVSELLLTGAGIDNMRVTRYGGTSRHYWNLINPDGDAWYHFDTTPTRRELRFNRFMFTESMAASYTDETLRLVNHPNYYTYDKSLYPPIAP